MATRMPEGRRGRFDDAWAGSLEVLYLVYWWCKQLMDKYCGSCFPYPPRKLGQIVPEERGNYTERLSAQYLTQCMLHEENYS